MKNVILIVSFAFLFFSFSTQNNTAMNQTTEWFIGKKSSISILGSSNVNRFVCSSKADFTASSLKINKLPSSHKVNMNGDIKIFVETFDCGNRMITSDMRKTLKSKEYPILEIGFVTIDRIPDERKSSDSMNGIIEINLAGLKKRFSIALDFKKTESSYKLEGSRAFCFDDFNLSPPQKVGGLIKVNDSFEVNFSLELITKLRQ